MTLTLPKIYDAGDTVHWYELCYSCRKQFGKYAQLTYDEYEDQTRMIKQYLCRHYNCPKAFPAFPPFPEPSGITIL